MRDITPEIYLRALRDYRLALGAELSARRANANYSLQQLASASAIPAETLRTYEQGLGVPQLVRVARIADAYGATWLDLLEEAATYVHRAAGAAPPHTTGQHLDARAVRALLLFCGVTPAQLADLELPRHQDPGISPAPEGQT